MSYADQARPQRPFGMAAAIAVNGSIIAAIMLSPMVVNPPSVKPRTTTVFVDRETPPPEPVTEDPAKPKQHSQIFVPPSPVAIPIKADPIRISEDPVAPDAGPGPGTADTGKGEAPDFTIKVDPPLPPVFSGAKRDMRYAKDFQPSYPSSLLVREIEGSATIRVLIGTDGRVREAIIVSATHPDFGKAAARQALKAWRFKPAMRGNEPVEDWVTIPVTFQIN